MEPTPPAAPVTTSSRSVFSVPWSWSASTHSAAVKPAVPMAIEVRASSPCGMGSTIDSFTRARWENPPHQLTPSPLPVTSTGSPGRNRALVLDAHAAREVDAGHHRPLADDLPPTGERQPVLVVERAVGDVDGDLARRQRRLLERVRLTTVRPSACSATRAVNVSAMARGTIAPAGTKLQSDSGKCCPLTLAGGALPSGGAHVGAGPRSQGERRGRRWGRWWRGEAWAVACGAVADHCGQRAGTAHAFAHALWRAR